jgi:hypothetical protein
MPDRIAELEAENAALREVCAEAYQLAGTFSDQYAALAALDNLFAASTGNPLPHETILPVIRTTPYADALASAPEPFGDANHELKTWPMYFEAVLSGHKRFEIRRHDRDFKVGDVLLLNEYDPSNGYTGRSFRTIVTYITAFPDGLRDGYVCMGIAALEAPDA